MSLYLAVLTLFLRIVTLFRYCEFISSNSDKQSQICERKRHNDLFYFLFSGGNGLLYLAYIKLIYSAFRLCINLKKKKDPYYGFCGRGSHISTIIWSRN